MTMISSSVASRDKASCLLPSDLKLYLSGWCDEADAERIESHLAACSACELTLQELDVKPDTLLQSLQCTTVEKTSADENAISENAEQPLDAALEKARKLMDLPAESGKSRFAHRESGYG